MLAGPDSAENDSDASACGAECEPGKARRRLGRGRRRIGGNRADIAGNGVAGGDCSRIKGARTRMRGRGPVLNGESLEAGPEYPCDPDYVTEFKDTLVVDRSALVRDSQRPETRPHCPCLIRRQASSGQVSFPTAAFIADRFLGPAQHQSRCVPKLCFNQVTPQSPLPC